MSKTLDDRRHEAAAAEFDAYDFGGDVVADSSGWESEAPGVEMRRAVFFENQENPEGDSILGSFRVRFASPDGAEVVDAYGTIDGADVGHREPERVLSSAGFEKTSVGGGLVAWRKNLDDGTHLLLTDDHGQKLWTASRFDDQGGFVVVAPPLYVGPALRVVSQLPAPSDIDAVGSQHEFKTLAEAEATVAPKGSPGP